MSIFSSKRPQAKQHYIHNKLLRCMHCSHDLLHERLSTLPAAPTSFKDWAHRHAVCYECAECGFLHWFIQKD